MLLTNYRLIVEQILSSHDSPASKIDALTLALEKAEGDGWRTALKHVGEQIRELGA